MNVLSMGAGVQTTACLIKYNTLYDHVVFADTGDEHQATYDYINKYLKPFCEQHNITWHTISDGRWDSLLDYCEDKQKLPGANGFRFCTTIFKTDTITRYLKTIGASASNVANMHIGISLDESNRLPADANTDKPKYKHKVYPLIDDKITRAQCHEIIKQHGWPSPTKSGCDFCPYAGRKHVRKLSYENPAKYQRLITLEKNTGHTLFDKPLTQSEPLDVFFDDGDTPEQTCDSGHCFV